MCKKKSHNRRLKGLILWFKSAKYSNSCLKVTIMKVKQLLCEYECVCVLDVLAIYVSAIILLHKCANEKLNEILAEAKLLRSFCVYM